VRPYLRNKIKTKGQGVWFKRYSTWRAYTKPCVQFPVPRKERQTETEKERERKRELVMCTLVF
jgi:hypothetical protein